MILPALFHWSPRERRDEILRQGLQLFSASSSGREEEDWDLWQVTLAEHDQVRVRTERGPLIWEVKVHNAIPADRLWWVGQRQPWLT